MELEYFEKVLSEYRKGQKMISELYSIGFDLMDGKFKLDEAIYNLFITCLDSHYTDMGVDWVTWFIYENEWGEKDWSKSAVYKRNDEGVTELCLDHNGHGATDENGDSICYDIPSLWEYIEKEHRKVNI